MNRSILLIALLVATSTLVVNVPAATARPETPAACTNEINDDGSCASILCVWPTPSSAGTCAPVSATEKVCTQGHAPCAGLDVVCAYGKIHECIIGCACYVGATVAQAPTVPAQPGDCTGCFPYLCVKGVNAAHCWGPGGDYDVCLYFSLEVPFCRNVPASVQLPDPTQPCDWLAACPPCQCIPLEASAAAPLLPDGSILDSSTCATPNCQLPVGACVKMDSCSGGHDACVYGFSWVPFCVDVPVPCEQPYFECTSPIEPSNCATPNCQLPVCVSASCLSGPDQCTVLVGSGAAAGECVIGKNVVGPVRTCDTCTVLFYEECTVGTEGTRCWSNDGIN